MTPPPETLITDRLVLRRPMLTDAPAVYEYGRDPEVTRYLIFPTHKSLADANGFLGTCRARWESGEEYYWLITVSDQQRTWAADRPEIYRVWAVCDVENATSARVLEKLGMSREGVLRRWIVHPNISPESRDCSVYARVRSG